MVGVDVWVMFVGYGDCYVVVEVVVVECGCVWVFECGGVGFGGCWLCWLYVCGF